MVLEKGERLLCVLTEVKSGPGWINRPLVCYILTVDRGVRTVYVQPADQTEVQRRLYTIAGLAHTELLLSVSTSVRRTKATPEMRPLGQARLEENDLEPSAWKVRNPGGTQWVLQPNKPDESWEKEALYSEETVQMLLRVLGEATSHLVGAASAYEKYARRSSTLIPRARTDPFFGTRSLDFKLAADSCQSALRRLLGLK